MLRKVLLISTALLFCGCTYQSLTSPPKRKVSIDKLSQNGKANVYLCKGGKTVRVVQNKIRGKNTKKLSQVTVTFNEISEKLLLGISERGQNYSNVRWNWSQRDDYSSLTTSVGVVLAEQCVLQRSEINTN